MVFLAEKRRRMLACCCKVLVVTNDFPPRQGGIQSYVHELARRQPEGSLVVYASDHEGSREFDAAQPFPVVRHPTGLLVPTPAARRRIVSTLREYDADTVWFGASAPLGLLAPALREAGARRVVASTHGHEAAWAMLPATRQALRRIGAHCDVVAVARNFARSRCRRFEPSGVTMKLAPAPTACSIKGAVWASAAV